MKEKFEKFGINIIIMIFACLGLVIAVYLK